MQDCLKWPPEQLLQLQSVLVHLNQRCSRMSRAQNSLRAQETFHTALPTPMKPTSISVDDELKASALRWAQSLRRLGI